MYLLHAGLLRHTFCGKDAGAILEDEGPAHQLSTDIAELCHHAIAVVLVGYQQFDAVAQIAGYTDSGRLWNLDNHH